MRKIFTFLAGVFVCALVAINALGQPQEINSASQPDQLATTEASPSVAASSNLTALSSAQVAEKIVEMVPCAEMVRFGKNGSDATAGAVRLARAFTGRDHIAVCGYMAGRTGTLVPLRAIWEFRSPPET